MGNKSLQQPAALPAADVQTQGKPTEAAAARQIDLVADGLLTIEEAFEFLRIKRSKFYKLMKDKKIGSVKIGRRRLIPLRLLLEFAANQLA